MTDKQAEIASQADAGQEVERIRDIIFGSQMRDYEHRFHNFQRDLERLQQEFDRLSQQMADQDSAQGKKLQDLRREMRNADKDLREELRQVAQRLTDDKVDREILANLFVELGTHLKTGGSLADLLDNLTESGQAQSDDGK